MTENNILKTIISLQAEGIGGVKKDLNAVELAALKAKNAMKTITVEADAAQKKQADAGKMVVERLAQEEAARQKALKTARDSWQREVKSQKLLHGGAQKLLDSSAAQLTNAQKQKVLNEANNKILDDKNKKLGEMKNKLLSVGMTALFGGMAIKAMAQGMLRGLINTYQLATSESSAFSVVTAELSGAWAYLKYSIMDALMQSGLITWFIDGLITFMDYLAGLPDAVKVGFGVFLIALLIIGGTLMVVGQGIMLVNGLVALFGIGVGLAFGILISALIVIPALIAALVAIWTSDMSTAEKILWTVVAAIVALGVVLLLVFGLAALPFVILMVMIGIIIGLFALMANKLGGVQNAFAAVGIFILYVFGQVVDFIANVFIGVINLAIDAVNALIIAWNYLNNNPLDENTIDRIEFVNTSAYADDLKANLLAEVEADKEAQASAKDETTDNSDSSSSTINIENLNLDSTTGFDIADIVSQTESYTTQLNGVTKTT